MNLNRGDVKPLYSMPVKKTTSETSNSMVDQLNGGVADMSFNSKQNNGWSVFVKKSKNMAGNSGAEQRMHGDHLGNGSKSNFPAHLRSPAGRGNEKPHSVNQDFENNSVAHPPVVQTHLKHGFSWSSIVASAHSAENVPDKKENAQTAKVPEEEDDNESYMSDDTDEELLSDEFDSDASEKSHETRKDNLWFKEFFNCINSLTTEQINDPERQWHCPACKGGPGGIDWFRGLYPLTIHAKTRKSKRAKVHRELAALLEEELCRRGTSVVQAGETFRRWNGLATDEKDFEIVWPPIVMVMNTRLEKDENDKWIGMGNHELLEYFGSYAAIRARHSYGPQGHRGISLLIFDASPGGYLEAERLSKHFTDKARDRDAWEQNRVTFYPGGKRPLYGYMAEKRDIDYFNQHCHGKSRLKFEMRSHCEMVVNPIKKMNEDNQQLMRFKNKAAEQQMQVKALEESVTLMSEKYRQTLEENKLVRLRTKIHHEENKEEMDFQEQFFKDQITIIYDNRNAKEESFEKIQHDHFDKVKQSQPNPSPFDDHQGREEEIGEYRKLHNYELEREKLIKAYDERVGAMRRRHREEEAALEKEFDGEISMLMHKYTPPPPLDQSL